MVIVSKPHSYKERKMKGKYLILALAIAVQGVHAMSPAQEGLKREQLQKIMADLPNATTNAQANSLRSQGDSIINELTNAGRPTKRLKTQLDAANQQYTTRTTMVRRRAAEEAEREQLRAYGEIEVAGSTSERVEAVLKNLVNAINTDSRAVGALSTHQAFNDNQNKLYNLNDRNIHIARNILMVDRNAMKAVENQVNGYFDQFTDIVGDLTRADKNSLKVVGAFAAYKAKARGAINSFVSQVQRAVLDNINTYKTNADSENSRNTAQGTLNSMVRQAAKFLTLTNSLGITDENIATFKAKYGVN